eukprot:2242243-Pyramimonas_sp.AAC.1
MALLLAAGVAADSEDTFGFTPLIRAAEGGHAAAAEALLQAGAKLEWATKLGVRALMAAAEGGHAECVRTLAGWIPS